MFREVVGVGPSPATVLGVQKSLPCCPPRGRTLSTMHVWAKARSYALTCQRRDLAMRQGGVFPVPRKPFGILLGAWPAWYMSCYKCQDYSPGRNQVDGLPPALSAQHFLVCSVFACVGFNVSVGFVSTGVVSAGFVSVLSVWLKVQCRSLTLPVPRHTVSSLALPVP